MFRNNILDWKYRQLLLFKEEEMNPRLSADRDEVLRTFSPLADAIVTKMLEAGNDYLTYAEIHPVARQENTFTSSNLHGLLIEKLSQIPGVRRMEFCKRNTVVVVGPYKVWVKKLDERGMPWVNETMSSVKRVYQQAEGEDIMPILILGYQLDQIERISRIQLRYIEGDRQLWAPIDLCEMIAGRVSAEVTKSHTDEPEVTIKPEKKRKQIAS